MALRTDAAGDIFYRTTNLPSIAGPWTICLWYYPVTTVGYGTVLVCTSRDSPPSFFGAESLVLATNSAGTTLQLWFNNNPVASGSTISAGVWYPFWIVRGAAANRTDVYVNRSSTINIQATSTVTGTPASGLGGGDIGGGSVTNARHAALKWWSAVLTYAEMYAESQYVMPVRLDRLEGVYPWDRGDFATDYSPFGRTLTTEGALTVEDGPPILWAAPEKRTRFMPAAAAAPQVTMDWWMGLPNARRPSPATRAF